MGKVATNVTSVNIKTGSIAETAGRPKQYFPNLNYNDANYNQNASFTVKVFWIGSKLLQLPPSL
jgi:hypothetical protein